MSVNRLRPPLAAFFGLLWFGGIFSYIVWGEPPRDAAWTAPVFLLVAALLVLLSGSRRQGLWLVLAGVFGFGIEVLGVHTGLPFSGYRYTDVLQPTLFGSPLAMICAWLVLVGYVREMLAGVRCCRWRVAFLGAAWMTSIDLVIDPLAAGPLGYWVWDAKGIYYGIPLQNFLGWFVTSLAIFAVLPRDWPPHTGAAKVGAAVVAFFTVIALAKGFAWPGLVGLSLLALHVYVAWRAAAGSCACPAARMRPTEDSLAR